MPQWIVYVRDPSHIVMGTDWDALAAETKGVRCEWGDLEYTFQDKEGAEQFASAADVSDESPVVEIVELDDEGEQTSWRRLD